MFLTFFCLKFLNFYFQVWNLEFSMKIGISIHLKPLNYILVYRNHHKCSYKKYISYLVTDHLKRKCISPYCITDRHVTDTKIGILIKNNSSFYATDTQVSFA